MIALRLPRLPRPSSPRRTLRDRARSLATATARILRFRPRLDTDHGRRAMMAGAAAFAASPLTLALALDGAPPADPIFAAIEAHRAAVVEDREAGEARAAMEAKHEHAKPADAWRGQEWCEWVETIPELHDAVERRAAAMDAEEAAMLAMLRTNPPRPKAGRRSPSTAAS